MKKRSGPIYLSSEGKVISLVEEIEIREIRLPIVRASLRSFGPSALYVIDEKGVERIRFRNVGVLNHLVMRPSRFTVYRPSGSSKVRKSPQRLSVFGQPRTVGDKTLIPVRSILHIPQLGRLTGSSTVPATLTRPAAIIELRNGKVCVRPRPSLIQAEWVIIFLAAYWLIKAVYTRRTRR